MKRRRPSYASSDLSKRSSGRQAHDRAKSYKWTFSAQPRSRTQFAAPAVVWRSRQARRLAWSARRRPQPPEPLAGSRSRLPPSPESSAHGSRSTSHGDANAEVCVSGDRAQRRARTSSRPGANARDAASQDANNPKGQFTEDDHPPEDAHLPKNLTLRKPNRPIQNRQAACGRLLGGASRTRTGDLLGAI